MMSNIQAEAQATWFRGVNQQFSDSGQLKRIVCEDNYQESYLNFIFGSLCPDGYNRRAIEWIVGEVLRSAFIQPL